MRGTLLQSLAILLLAFGCFGCATSPDSSIDAAGLSIVGQAPTNATNATTNSVTSGQLASQSDQVPFVRSEPEAVPPFPLVLNRTVQAYVDSYVDQPASLQQSFERINPYFAEMTRQLRSRGLPPELVYLTVAESGFADTGAGPWQLNRETARRFGLKINRWVDERRDPIKSTQAAAQYLTLLHDQTGSDWRMTLVAWNNGEAGVNRYIQLRDVSYERLMSRLPQRTRALLNRFMAVALIARHREEYGLEPANNATQQAAHYEVMPVRGGTPLKAVAKRCHTALEVLRDLNPALIRNCVPPSATTYAVRVPVSTGLGSQFAQADL